MLSLPPSVRVFVALSPLDMRGSFDALAGAVLRLGLDPVGGHLYLFMNKGRRIAKALWFDGSGGCVLAKRLETGGFQRPPLDVGQSQVQTDGSMFSSLLARIDFTAARRGGYRRASRGVGRSGIDTAGSAWSLRGMVKRAQLLEENARLRELLGQSQVAIRELVGQVARLNDQVAELVVIAARKQRKTPPPRPSAAPPVDVGEAMQALESRLQAPVKSVEPPRPKASPKRTGRNALPGHLQVEAHTLAPDACAHPGGAPLDVVDRVIEERRRAVQRTRRRDT